MLDDDLVALSDPAKDQYFLTNPAKLKFIVDASDIRDTDRVVEVGAGVGTVARALPRCASLTLIELDERLIPALRRNAPSNAAIRSADGIALLRQREVQGDVILANLPSEVAADLVAILPHLAFRVAVVASDSVKPFELLGEQLEYSVLTAIRGDDFTPPQPSTSYLIAARRRIA